MFVCTYAYYTILTRLQEYESYQVLTHVCGLVFTRLVIFLADHADADIVGMVHAHDLDASATVCGLVSETL